MLKWSGSCFPAQSPLVFLLLAEGRPEQGHGYLSLWSKLCPQFLQTAATRDREVSARGRVLGKGHTGPGGRIRKGPLHGGFGHPCSLEHPCSLTHGLEGAVGPGGCISQAQRTPHPVRTQLKEAHFSDSNVHVNYPRPCLVGLGWGLRFQV